MFQIKKDGDKLMQSNQYDIAIIGGGPAGLQAALVLARTRKQIIVFDDPQPPRNGASHGVHNFLGVDGLLPSEIRDLAWKQIDVYQSAELSPERVIGIQRGNDNHFQITGDKGASINAKHVILTFGYHDVYPDIPGFVDCWANTIIPCPFCDGYENRDRVWAIVASYEMEAQHFPKMVRNWTSDVKLILLPGVAIDSVYREELITSGISVHEGEITQIHHSDGKVEAVSLDTGEQIEVGTLLWTPPEKPSPLIQILVRNFGLELDENNYIKTNETQQTNVSGLWAAGDVQGGWSGALQAAYTSSTAAAMIVKDWYE
jgi:thioredoxin reductase